MRPLSVSVPGALNAIQRRLSRSPLAVRMSVLVRNQCQAVIGYHLGETHIPSENGEAWFARAVAPHCRFFIDVGANVGDWSALMVAHAPPTVQGLLVEPGKLAGERLEARLGGDPRLQIAKIALGAAPGEAFFYEETNGGESSSMIPNFVHQAGSPYRVAVSSLDREAALRGLDVVDLLKIDAEGYDARILRGATDLLTARRIRAVQFEYNVNWLAAGDTLLNTTTWLRGVGYELYLLTRTGLKAFDYGRFGDFFRYSNFVALAPGAREAFHL